MNLTTKQLERYARNIALDEVGIAGQERLLSAKVLLIGVGGLGSPAALYLAAAGVGHLGLADGDTVDITNLQRQIIHSTPEIGTPKVISAKDKINRLNPDVSVTTYPIRVTPENIVELAAAYDFVIDCTDNFDSKFMIADGCHQAKTPYCHGGILKFSGQLMTVIPGQTACYRCIFREPPEHTADEPLPGVMGILPGIIGTLQAAEAIKFILRRGELLTNRLLIYDALLTTFRTVDLQRDQACSLCGTDTTTP